MTARELGERLARSQQAEQLLRDEQARLVAGIMACLDDLEAKDPERYAECMAKLQALEDGERPGE